MTDAIKAVKHPCGKWTFSSAIAVNIRTNQRRWNIYEATHLHERVVALLRASSSEAVTMDLFASV